MYNHEDKFANKSCNNDSLSIQFNMMCGLYNN